MPIGIIIDSLAVVLGGLVGSVFGERISKSLKDNSVLVFGIISMSLGIKYIILMESLAAVVLSTILGLIVGELIKINHKIEWLADKMKNILLKALKNPSSNLYEDIFLLQFTSIVILFCFSGTGIFGSLEAGFSGNHSVLLTKAILDFFTAIIFASLLGPIVSLIAIPQFIIFISLFVGASFLLPYVSPSMYANFTAAGGILMLATGFNITEIKVFPVANMLPVLILIFIISPIVG